jgi:uncharacterized protein YjaZ
VKDYSQGILEQTCSVLGTTVNCLEQTCSVLEEFSLKEHKQNKYFKEYNIKEIKNTPVILLIPTKNQEEFKEILKQFKTNYLLSNCELYMCHLAENTNNYVMKEILAIMFKDNPDHPFPTALFTPKDVYEVDYRVEFLNYWLKAIYEIPQIH